MQQVLTLNEAQNVRLTCYLYDRSPEYTNLDVRPAILVIPGGGYHMCSDREAEPIALAFAAAGFHAFVLRYTVHHVKPWPAPLADYEQAMETILAHAEEWGVDKERIAVVGFSAGGHLAACAATIAAHKPAAAILGYAVLTAETSDQCVEGLPAPVDLVDADTAPCFLFATRTDNVVPIRNTLAFEQKLDENGISFESHIYSYGPHGFGNGGAIYNQPPLCPRAGTWMEDSICWLSELWGARTFEGYASPKFGRVYRGDKQAYLSADCSYRHLAAQQGKAQEILKAVFERVETGMRSNVPSSTMKMLEGWTLRELLPLIGFTKEEIDAFDEQLRAVKNAL